MVRRSDKAKGIISRKRLVKGVRRGRERRDKSLNDVDAFDLQQRGVLNINNPLIPPELDEDIDDDLAFNSDDEEKYGHFFQKKTKPESSAARAKAKKKSKIGKNSSHCGDNADSGRDPEVEEEEEEEAFVLQQLRALGEIENDEDLDFHEKECGGDDDDYVDILDMLDAGQMEENDGPGAENVGKKKNRKKADEKGVAKKRRRAPVTEEAESIYGSTATKRKYSTVIRNVVAAAPSSSVQSRIEQSLANKNNLISVDIDDYKKAAVTRSEVRKVIDNDLAKYKSFLREQCESKHVQLPMVMPESNPVPKNLGAVAEAAKNRILQKANGEDVVVGGDSKPRGIGEDVACVSAFRLAGKMNALLSSAGLAKQDIDVTAGEDCGVVPFADDDDNDGNDNRKTFLDRNKLDAPSRGYMAKLKAILSSENARRRRMNRIKSKTYRRILRKEKEREKERRERAFELLHPEKARARLAKKLLKARVEERVTQKHKNTSKWVRHAKRFANFDGNTMDAINEQNLLHQKLMQKMEEEADEDEFLNAAGGGGGGLRADSEAASSEEERVVDHIIADVMAGEEQNGVGGGAVANKKNLTALLWGTVDDLVEEEGGKAEAAVSGMTPTEKARVELRQMKFMQQATQREEKRYAEMLESLQNDIRRDMRGETLDSGDELSDIHESVKTKTKAKKKKTKTLGVCDNSSSAGRKAFLGRDAGTKGSQTVENIKMKRHCGIDARNDEENNEDENNYCGDHPNANADGGDTLSVNSSSGSAGDEDDFKNKTADMEITCTKKCNDGKDVFAGARQPKVVVTFNSSSSSAAVNGTVPEARKKARSTRITILPGENKQTKEQNVAFNSSLLSVDRTKEKEENGKKYDEEASLQQQQEYLIARAFADDEVDADFLAEKTAQVETIMKPVDKNETLPGWGEWGGADERLNAKHQAKLQTIELQREIEKTTLLKSRADAKLDHVIINHDGVELVPDRMLLHMIPRPFSNPTEFARSMRHPQGPEWNTALTYKDCNQPRVEVRQGHAVMPLDFSLRGKKRILKTKRRKALEAGVS